MAFSEFRDLLTAVATAKFLTGPKKKRVRLRFVRKLWRWGGNLLRVARYWPALAEELGRCYICEKEFERGDKHMMVTRRANLMTAVGALCADCDNDGLEMLWKKKNEGMVIVESKFWLAGGPKKDDEGRELGLEIPTRPGDPKLDPDAPDLPQQADPRPANRPNRSIWKVW